MARKIEPSAPSVNRRFETIRELAEAGIRVGIGVAPIIPGLNDQDVPALLKRAKECGAAFAFRTLLRLPGSVRAVFLRRISEEFPERAEHVVKRIRDVRGGKLSESRFGLRHHGKGTYWEAIDQLWNVWVKRTGLSDPDEEDDATMTAPPGRQGELFPR
jgi:DNA repair photolyase